MSSVTSAPALSPAMCFDERTLRDFLRISRGAIDDTISQSLNSLLEPARNHFDPSSTSQRQLGPQSRRPVPAEACERFRQQVLFPSWQARSDVINYCAGVATSPDPNDPDHVLREVEDAEARERLVNERLDPYSGRYFPRELRTERLAALMRSERSVEEIVRQRTWQIMTERCAPAPSTSSWSEAMARWRSQRTR